MPLYKILKNLLGALVAEFFLEAIDGFTNNHRAVRFGATSASEQISGLIQPVSFRGVETGGNYSIAFLLVFIL